MKTIWRGGGIHVFRIPGLTLSRPFEGGGMSSSTRSRMNHPQDITASITSFRLPVTPRNLNKRTVRTGHYPLSANILERHNQVG